MATKKRNPENTAISLSLPKDLLARIDSRADSLGLSRSNYLCQIAEADLRKPGPLVISPASSIAVIEAVRMGAEHALKSAKAKARQ